MQPRKIILYLSKFTLLDELLGFLYWFLVIVGIYFAFHWIDNKLILALMLTVYVVSAVFLYLYLLKMAGRYFKKG